MPDTFTRTLVSIGMPLYNAESYVAASIEAHLAQTYADFELILTDNASTDRSEEICRSYASRDSRIRYHRNPRNLGATANYRLAFELAQGPYFRWSPADDLVSPNLLERAVEILSQDSSVFVAYPRTKLIDDKGDFLEDFAENLHLLDERPSLRWKNVRRNIRMGNLHYGLSRRDLLGKTGLIRNYAGGDFPLIAEMSLYGKFFEIPDAFFYRRMHAQASSALKSSADVMALYDPSKRKNFFAYNWVHLGANLRSIARAPIPLSEKLRAWSFEARWLVWGRREYLRELAGFASHATDKVRGR